MYSSDKTREVPLTASRLCHDSEQSKPQRFVYLSPAVSHSDENVTVFGDSQFIAGIIKCLPAFRCVHVEKIELVLVEIMQQRSCSTL